MLTENARAREEAERRIAAANRRMDHLERARREEEAPLLERAYQKKVRPSTIRNPCMCLSGELAAPKWSHRTSGRNQQNVSSWWKVPTSRRCRYTGWGISLSAAADSIVSVVSGEVVRGICRSALNDLSYRLASASAWR